ncbi:MAG: hypothetical protein ACLTPN_00930 [Clostridia bacterium]|jgi:hypothetical protein
MIFDFGFNEVPLEDCVIEVKVGNQIQKQRIQGMQEMIQIQFMQLLQQAGHSDQPIRVKLIKQDDIWCQLKKQFKTLENYIQFANNKYMEAFSEEFKE